MVLVERTPTWGPGELPRLREEVKEYIPKKATDSKAQELLQPLATSWGEMGSS